MRRSWKRESDSSLDVEDLQIAPTKEIFVVADPNGSGKTTFAEEFLAQRPCDYVSADLIAQELAPDDVASVRISAARGFLARIGQRVAGVDSFLVESTLSGRAFRRTLEESALSGFESTIIFVYLDSPNTCVLRVNERVRGGGHHVPEADIRRRFTRSLANFWQMYRQLADHWLLVYNGGNGFQDVAFGAVNEVSIGDETLFRRFLRSAGVDNNE